MAQISPSAPASGPIRTMAPNSTDCTPPLIVYFLVQLDRADDLENAMNYCQSTDEQHRRIAPGHRKVMAPAANARDTTATSRQVGRRRPSVTSVSPGWMNARPRTHSRWCRTYWLLIAMSLRPESQIGYNQPSL